MKGVCLSNNWIMSAMASRITSVSIVCSTLSSGADQRKHQCSAPLAFVRRSHRSPVNSPHKGQWRRKCFYLITSSCDASDDVILSLLCNIQQLSRNILSLALGCGRHTAILSLYCNALDMYECELIKQTLNLQRISLEHSLWLTKVLVYLSFFWRK